MTIMEIYEKKYSDDVLEYANIYNAADTAAAIKRAEKAASKPEELDAMDKMYFRGLKPVMAAENDLFCETLGNVKIQICKGCEISWCDLRRIAEDCHG